MLAVPQLQQQVDQLVQEAAAEEGKAAAAAAVRGHLFMRNLLSC